MRNFTQTRACTHTSVQYSDWFLFLQCRTACLTILHRYLYCKWHVRPILAVSWQPHCLLSHIWAADSVVPCFDMPVTRTVSSPCLVLSKYGRSKVSTAQLHHPAQYTFFICTWHTAVSTTVVYCLQSKLPIHQSANITVHCTQNEKNVNIQLCQYQYPWLVHNELEWMWKE